ncbi:hypothetical protein XM38_046180 [Halomicronema hongdechloris C2206]|uniref:Uncharacterized protein n=1 Tax=Halomicronema hongdechloris C2206 TaxID=1641165 RepID=A0A1Z3HTR0_9CYAN|nr:Npun_F0813 family protein [Halomicronema hongdechloris]ASC73646.1 hypothetical protein XM38_046180 [Halomicronema hongdechloris C2206]
MFILKRQDVDIKTIQHPKKEQQIPILSYQGQTFRLLSVFTIAQADDARALWRDLTDNRGKACVLLEEPERFSIWGKIRLEQLAEAGGAEEANTSPVLIQGCLVLLQAVYIDIEDLLGSKQAGSFQQEVETVLTSGPFPRGISSKVVQGLLTIDPLAMPQMPAWTDHHLQQLLQDLHRIGKDYFGNTTFTERALEALQDMPDNDRKLFTRWLQQSPVGKLWS